MRGIGDADRRTIAMVDAGHVRSDIHGFGVFHARAAFLGVVAVSSKDLVRSRTWST
jgi:hypothetical protein